MDRGENRIPLTGWMTAAILAPLAIAAPESGWAMNLTIGVLAAAILPGVNKAAEKTKSWVRVGWIGWSAVLLIYYLGYLPAIWQGSDNLFLPVCMLLLGAWGTRKGKEACAGVGAVLMIFVLLLFGGVGLAGAEEIQWNRVLGNGIVFRPSAIVAYLLPGTISCLREKTNDKNKAKEILYTHIQSKNPINVSTEYYMICKDDCVFMTYDVYKKFKELNKEDFIKHYFKNINGIFVIYESAEMFPTKGKEPYKGFGHNTNVKLISYLLSTHDIYLQYVWLDEDCISRVAIAEKVSNMSTINDEFNR